MWTYLKKSYKQWTTLSFRTKYTENCLNPFNEKLLKINLLFVLTYYYLFQFIILLIDIKKQ